MISIFVNILTWIGMEIYIQHSSESIQDSITFRAKYLTGSKKLSPTSNIIKQDIMFC